MRVAWGSGLPQAASNKIDSMVKETIRITFFSNGSANIQVFSIFH